MYDDLLEKYGRQFNVDPALLGVFLKKESSGNRKAVGPETDYGRARGLMQIMPGNFKKLGVTDPEDPEQNIRAGAQLISEGLDKYGDVEGAARYYYGGSNERLHGPKTRTYAKSIAARYMGGGEGEDTMRGGISSKTDVDAILFGQDAPSGAQGSKGSQSPSGALADDNLGKSPNVDDVLFGDSVPSDAGSTTPSPTGKPGPEDSDLPIGDTGHYASHGQRATWETLVKGNAYDAAADPGTLKNPRYITPETTVEDVPDGEYYVDRSGQLLRKGGPAEGSFSTGVARGVGDVLQSVTDITSGITDPNNESDLRNYLAANKLRYEAQHKGDLKSGVGRFTGQMVATLPAMATGEFVLAPVARAAGPVGEFLLGRAGQAALPEGATLANKLVQGGVRLGSQAAKGAQEGATAAALVSSANDQPLPEQLKTGAILGGVLSPAAGLVTGGVRNLITGGATKGAIPEAEQAAIQAKAAGLPVPVPLTRGQITLSPVQQMEESALAKGVHGEGAAKVMKGQEERVGEALAGNVEAMQQKIAGQALEPGEGPRLAAEALNAQRNAAKAAVDAAYQKARESGTSAMLDTATAKAARDEMLGTLRSQYGTGNAIQNVMHEVETFGADGAPTVQDMMEFRTRLSNLRSGTPSVETKAAGDAIKALDAHLSRLLTDDLIIGDPNAVKMWRAAVKSRADFGKLFEGKDAIQALTERAQRGGEMGNKIDPQDAANYLFNRSDLGMIGKKDLTRDVKRIRDVLGPDSPEWAGVRSEVFQRLASAGRGPSTPGSPINFSGQKFAEAWGKMNAKSPELVRTMFTPEERQMISDFADIAQRATAKVKGGDNPSGSGFVVLQATKKALSNLGAVLGGGAGSLVGGPGGGAAGAGAGRVFDNFMRDIGAVVKAKKAISPPPVSPSASRVSNRLVARPVTVGGAIAGQNKLTSPQPSPVP